MHGQTAIPAATWWHAATTRKIPRAAPGKPLTPVASTSQATGDRSMAELTGQCPTATVTINRLEVTAPLDTGSEISTVPETWAAAHLQDLPPQQAYLFLRSVNGAEVPYSGILLVDIDIFGTMCPDVPVLVVKGPTELYMQLSFRQRGRLLSRGCRPGGSTPAVDHHPWRRSDCSPLPHPCQPHVHH